MEEMVSDTDEHIGETVCICGKSYEDDVFMIQCDICRDWLHGDCIKVDEVTASDIDKYHCPRCEPMCGPSIMKVETNWHRHDKCDPQATYKPLQVGTKLFVDELIKRIFPSADDIIMKVSGKQLTLPYLNQSGFNHPILVTDKDGLSMTTPQAGFNMDKIVSVLGEDYQLDAIDVHRQQACKMSIGQFADVFNNPFGDRVLNCLSLEVTDTPMADTFSPPLVARKLCWVNNVWPSVNSLPYSKPQVQKYCIMSMGGAFTDFHIDFGGTSVWYHIFEGEKYFYLIRPTPANISLYERWTRLSTQSETFLGDMVDRCYLLKLTPGQTVFIPTGWIHAVYTPAQSIVFGGNFLHSLNIQLQLRIYELENRLKDPPKFRFPSFEVVHWLAAGKLKKDLADLNSDNTPCPINLLNGIRSLVTTLKTWITDASRPAIGGLDCASILKDLSREVKNAERISLKINPPKPERESNRRRKKKNLAEDFIDITDAASLYLLDYQSSQTSPGAKKKKQEKVIAVKSKPFQQEPTLYSSQTPALSPSPTFPQTPLQNQDQFSQVVGYSPGGVYLPSQELPSYSAPLPPTPQLNTSQLSRLPHQLPRTPQLPQQQQQVTPLKLSLSINKDSQYQDGAIIDSRGEIPISKRAQAQPKFAAYDLTDRDAVRELLVTKKDEAATPSTPTNNLNSVLSAAVSDFGGDGGDDEGLVIDETKQPRKVQGRAGAAQRKSIKLRLSVGSESKSTILAAEKLQPEPYPSLDSPTTREAVAGMLSMSKAKLHPKMAVKASLKKKISAAVPKRRITAEEKINRVHQDDDYIYPTLDLSDDDDLPAVPPPDDEAWNPKIKMSNLGPKKERPVRDSAKNVAIEKGLKKAAENRNSISRLKGSKISKKNLNSKNFSNSSTSSSSLVSSKSLNFAEDRSRNRKPCSTAKQRLGKILGLKF